MGTEKTISMPWIYIVVGGSAFQNSSQTVCWFKSAGSTDSADGAPYNRGEVRRPSCCVAQASAGRSSGRAHLAATALVPVNVRYVFVYGEAQRPFPSIGYSLESDRPLRRWEGVSSGAPGGRQAGAKPLASRFRRCAADKFSSCDFLRHDSSIAPRPRVIHPSESSWWLQSCASHAAPICRPARSVLQAICCAASSAR